MDQAAWIDKPVVEALNYFQGLLAYFQNFANLYGNIIGLVGLLWTAFRLVNSRIGVRETFWDTFYKWMIYLALLNIYQPLTSGAMLLANKIALEAGNGMETISQNFSSLRETIEKDLDAFDLWKDNLSDVLSNKLGVTVEISVPSDNPYSLNKKTVNAQVKAQVEAAKGILPKQDVKFIKQSLETAFKNMPEKEESLWGSQTLEMLNQILVERDTEGNAVNDNTSAYVVDTDKLFLKNNDGDDTPFLSASAIFGVGLLAGQCLMQKAIMEPDNPDFIEDDEDSEEGSGWKPFKAIGDSINRLINRMVALGLFFIIIGSIACAIIQYVMCILEFIIIQGLGAFFIPFYLFDGTKDLPKKLVPVFTGMLIKIIVILVCLIFIIYLWLAFVGDIISPANGGILHPSTIAEVTFTAILSLVLTSNAPKIAMTLLTGQPQLSMGEFMAAVGTLAGGAMAAKNIAGTAASPAAAGIKNKVGEANQRHVASSKAKADTKAAQKASFDEAIGGKPGKGATKADKKAYNDEKKAYMKEHKNEFAAERKAAGKNASNEVRKQQKANYANAGGVGGTMGRVFAHYGGAALSPINTARAGRKYESPKKDPNGIDLVGIGQKNAGDGKPKASSEKNGVKDNVNGGGKGNSLPDKLTEGKGHVTS